MPYRKLKPQKHEKAKRNRRMAEYHDAHPETTYETIGEMNKISAARAYQIIARERKNRIKAGTK